MATGSQASGRALDAGEAIRPQTTAEQDDLAAEVRPDFPLIVAAAAAAPGPAAGPRRGASDAPGARVGAPSPGGVDSGAYSDAGEYHCNEISAGSGPEGPLQWPNRMVTCTPIHTYLDSAATAQKPRAVLQAMESYYLTCCSNIHRDVNALAAAATAAFEAARGQVAAFVGAGGPEEIVWTANATGGINLVAQAWGDAHLRPGDEIVLHALEHHSNLVPWQLLAQRTGAELRFCTALTPTEGFDLGAFTDLIGPRTRLVAVTHVSNVLGCVVPIAAIAAAAHRFGALLLVDACQSVPHLPIDVRAMGCDFLVASGHKMCGPTGVGFLWGRPELLSIMRPWAGGGDLLEEVRIDRPPAPARPPLCFEAGTPPIAEVIGLGAAVAYLSRVGMARIAAHEARLGAYLHASLARIPGVRIYGPPPAEGRAALAAFTVEGWRPAELAVRLSAAGVAIRAGHHACQPLHRLLGIPGGATARASAYLYTTEDDVDALVSALQSLLAAGRGEAGASDSVPN